MMKQLELSIGLLLLIPAAVEANRPVATDRTLVAVEGKPLVISAATLLSDQWFVSRGRTLIQATAPRHGRLVADDQGGFAYYPDVGFFGNDTFTYTVTNASGTSRPATVSLWTAPWRIAFSGNWSGDPGGMDEFAWLNNQTGKLVLCGATEQQDCTRASTDLDLAGRDPLAMDVDGDGFDEIAFFSSSTGTLSITQPVGRSASRSLRILEEAILPEAVGLRPLAGDWNGDGIDSIGFFQPATGRFQLRGNNFAIEAGHTFFVEPSPHGLPIVGDWNGDRMETIGIFEPRVGTMTLSNDNQTGKVALILTAPTGGIPVSGPWTHEIDALQAGTYHRDRHMIFVAFNYSDEHRPPRSIFLPEAAGSN